LKKYITIIALVFLGCGLPFFPETGTPLEGQINRDSPQGVLDELVRSYETQRIQVFKTLFDQVNFRFYVANDPLIELSNMDLSRTEIIIDTLVGNLVNSGPYNYIPYADELEIHENLFQRATQIEFTADLIVNERVVLDTFVRVDSLYDTVCIDTSTSVCIGDAVDSINATGQDVFDTIAQIVSTFNTQLLIAAQEIKNEYNEDTYLFDLGPQVFEMRRDEQGLWEIYKWFDIGL